MIIVIQARMGSKRLPGKVLMPLYGRPMLYRLIERMRETHFPMIVATGAFDHNSIIVNKAKEWGVDVFKGDENDVMSRLLLTAGLTGHEDIVRVTGDNPLTDPDILRLLVKIHLQNNNEYTWIDGPPSGTKCEVINVEALQRLRNETLDSELQENMTPALKTLQNQKVPCPIEWLSDLRLTVDTKEDMLRTQKIYNYYKGYPPHLSQLLTEIKVA